MASDDPASAGPSEHAFTLEEERVDGGRAVVTLGGEVDLHTAPELRERLGAAIDDGCREIVVDLTQVTFVDSMTLGVLLGALKRLRQQSGELKIVVSDPSLRRIFEITLLDNVFQLFDSRDRALADGRAPDAPTS
jgi:anti-sigma B factor antagonist